MHESADILTADERDVVAEFLAVEFDQTAAVAGFFVAHAVENGGGGGKS